MKTGTIQTNQGISSMIVSENSRSITSLWWHSLVTAHRSADATLVHGGEALGYGELCSSIFSSAHFWCLFCLHNSSFTSSSFIIRAQGGCPAMCSTTQAQRSHLSVAEVVAPGRFVHTVGWRNSCNASRWWNNRCEVFPTAQTCQTHIHHWWTHMCFRSVVCAHHRQRDCMPVFFCFFIWH